MLELRDIMVTLGKNSTLKRQIFDAFNLHVTQGEFLIVVGANGAGKSTMLNLISGLLIPDAGKVILDGIDVTKHAQNKRAKFISKVAQDPKIGTIANMTIYENMALAQKRGHTKNFLPFYNKQNQQLFREKLAILNMGLENRLEDVVANLSGGQRQALSLTMSVLAEAKLLLLDEITAALDPKIANKVMEIANQIIATEKLACIMITHNMLHATQYGDRLILLKDGSIHKEYAQPEKRELLPTFFINEIGEL